MKKEKIVIIKGVEGMKEVIDQGQDLDLGQEEEEDNK